MKAVQVQPVAEQWITQRTDRTHTGILLGQSWDQRVFILSAISTPALPKSSGGAGWSRVDWFQEHARQVRRMLVGGVEIVGMFVADSNAERAKSFESEVKDMVYGLPVSATSVDRILLRAGAGIKGLSGESYTGLKKDAIKPKPLTGIKVQPITPNLVAFESTLYLDVSIPVQPASSVGGVPLKQQLRRGLEAWQASVMAAQATINGAAVDGSIVIEKAFTEGGGSSAGKGKGGKGKGKSSSSSSSSSSSNDSADASAHLVEFFLRPTPLPPADSTATGVVRLHGSCHCRVYAHNKFTVAQALLSLKHDVINSLQSRLQLLCEDSEDAMGAFDLPAADEASFVWQLPRRLFQPLVRPACVCDYLLSHESAEDGVRRIAELLGVENLKEQGGEPFTREECAEGEDAAQRTENSESKGEAGSATSSSASSGASSSAPAAATKPAATAATPAAANPMLIIAFLVLAIALSAAFFMQLG